MRLVIAPAGTVATTCVFVTSVGDAGRSPKSTRVTAERPVPVIVTMVPGRPSTGTKAVMTGRAALGEGEGGSEGTTVGNGSVGALVGGSVTGGRLTGGSVTGGTVIDARGVSNGGMLDAGDGRSVVSVEGDGAPVMSPAGALARGAGASVVLTSLAS